GQAERFGARHHGRLLGRVDHGRLARGLAYDQIRVVVAQRRDALDPEAHASKLGERRKARTSARSQRARTFSRSEPKANTRRLRRLAARTSAPAVPAPREHARGGAHTRADPRAVPGWRGRPPRISPHRPPPAG